MPPGRPYRPMRRELRHWPELRARLDDQRRALSAIAVARGLQAPASLRAWLEQAAPRARSVRTWPARLDFAAAQLRPIRLGFAGALAAAVAAVLVLLGGAGPVPTVAQAVALGTRAPTARVDEPARV